MAGNDAANDYLYRKIPAYRRLMDALSVGPAKKPSPAAQETEEDRLKRLGGAPKPVDPKDPKLFKW